MVDSCGLIIMRSALLYKFFFDSFHLLCCLSFSYVTWAHNLIKYDLVTEG